MDIRNSINIIIGISFLIYFINKILFKNIIKYIKKTLDTKICTLYNTYGRTMLVVCLNYIFGDLGEYLF